MPPAEAFDRVRRLPPPNLPGPPARAPQGQRAGQSPGQPGPKAKATAQSKAGQKQAKAPPPKKKKPVNPARRRLRRRVAAVLAVVVLITGGAWLSVNLLFKIEKFELEGESPYTVEQVAAAFGLGEGDNMYGFSVGGAAERITTSLPYIEAVNIRRRLPSTILFQVTGAAEGYAVPCDEGVAVLSTQRKVLRVVDAVPEGLVRIEGLEGIAAEPGQPLALTEAAAKIAPQSSSATLPGAAGSAASGTDSGAESDTDTSGDDSAPPAEGEPPAGEGDTPAEGEADTGDEDAATGDTPAQPEGPTPTERFEVLGLLLDALDASALEEVTWVDVSDPLNLRFCWENRVTVLLGPRSSLTEKLRAVVVQLTDPEYKLVDAKEVGTLDMTYYIATGRSYFSPE